MSSPRVTRIRNNRSGTDVDSGECSLGFMDDRSTCDRSTSRSVFPDAGGRVSEKFRPVRIVGPIGVACIRNNPSGTDVDTGQCTLRLVNNRVRSRPAVRLPHRSTGPVLLWKTCSNHDRYRRRPKDIYATMQTCTRMPERRTASAKRTFKDDHITAPPHLPIKCPQLAANQASHFEVTGP